MSFTGTNAQKTLTKRKGYQPKPVLALVWIITASSALAGCGGASNGGSPATSTSGAARAMPTNVIRTVLNGDRIQYTVTGSVNGTVLSGTASSTITINGSPADPNGNKQTLGTSTINATLSTGAVITSTSNAYLSQDATGTLFKHGDSVSGWITTPTKGFVTAMPSPVISPYSWVNTFTNQNGDSTTETISIGGPVVVTTGAGTFDCYTFTTDSTQTLAAGGKNVASQVSYIVPDIGTVKTALTLTKTAASGAVTSSQFTLNMSGTNIAYP